MCDLINKQRQLGMPDPRIKVTSPRKRNLSTVGEVIEEEEQKVEMEDEEAQKSQEAKHEAEMDTQVENLINDAFEAERVTLDEGQYVSWDETLSIQKDNRFHVSEECHRACYLYTRDIENHLKPFPPIEVQERWNTWSTGKFYVAQSRVVLENTVNCKGLFTAFTFVPGDPLPFEGIIHNVKDGEEVPQYIIAAISEGYTLLVHQTGFKCYILGTKGVSSETRIIKHYCVCLILSFL